MEKTKNININIINKDNDLIFKKEDESNLFAVKSKKNVIINKNFFLKLIFSYILFLLLFLQKKINITILVILVILVMMLVLLLLVDKKINM